VSRGTRGKNLLEKLEVWQKAIDLADFGLDISEEISKRNKHFHNLCKLSTVNSPQPQP
jgi:hypothetical protein